MAKEDRLRRKSERIQAGNVAQREWHSRIIGSVNELKARTKAYFDAGGAPIRRLPVDVGLMSGKVKINKLERKEGEAGAIFADTNRLMREIQKGRGATGRKFTSGYGLRADLFSESSRILDQLSGGQYTKKFGKGSKFGDERVGPRKIEDRRKRQLGRDSRVASSAATKRNQLTARRNMQLTPGTSSDLAMRTKSLFAERRRGVIY